VKTVTVSFADHKTHLLFGESFRNGFHTKTRSEQSHVEVRHELLGIGIKHALAGGDIARQTDTDNFQHGLKDEQH
jgi:hypothetical protein